MDQLCLNYEEQILQIDSWVQLSDRLLVLNGNAAFLEHLKSRGVDFLNLCTSKGLFLSVQSMNSCYHIDDESISGIDFKGSKFVNGSPLPSPKELKNILPILQKFLEKNAQLCFWYENGLYFQEILDRASREQRPWPGHLPKIHSWDEKQFLEFCFANQINCLETSAENDPRMEDPNYLNYRFVNGLDCKIELPNDGNVSSRDNSHERDVYFEKKYFHICQLIK